MVGVTLVALGAQGALAGPFQQAWQLKQLCMSIPAQVKQCAFQFATGNGNKATTMQTTEQFGSSTSTQFSYTRQDGNDNTAFTEQIGTDQSSKTIQTGNGNFAGTYQEGEDQKAKTVQIGDGHWAATSSIGDGAETEIYSSNQ
ncbi:MAG: hypothetical protein JWQ89_4440 [Devosia sp.]|nr:hypothetical protein [Devosia sp.]